MLCRLEAMAEEVQDTSVADTTSLLRQCDTSMYLLEQLLVMEDNSLRLVMDTELAQPVYLLYLGGHWAIDTVLVTSQKNNYRAW